MKSFLFFFSSRRRHTRFDCDWSSDVCSSDLRVRIKNRQVRGPYHLAKVLQIRSDRIDQTRTKWQATNREHVAFPLLHEESHHAGDRYRAKKRDLLPSQPQKISAESGSWLMTQAAERPKV